MPTAEKDLYEVLGVQRDASQADIKKAYHKLALKLHPDKNVDDQEANKKFQALQRIYAVLGNTDKRKVYDDTGSLQDSEELAGEQFNDLYNCYRGIYRKVTVQDLEAYEAEYRGSEDESSDLVGLYERFKGDMDTVFAWLMCSDPKWDSHRFRDTIDKAIAAGEAKSYQAYKAWAKRIRATAPPRSPLMPRNRRAEEGSQALVAAIRGRQQQQQQQHDGFLADLEARFCGGQQPETRGGRGRKRGSAGSAGEEAGPCPPDDMDDAEFEATRERIEQRRRDAAAGQQSGKQAKETVKKRKSQR